MWEVVFPIWDEDFYLFHPCWRTQNTLHQDPSQLSTSCPWNDLKMPSIKPLNEVRITLLSTIDSRCQSITTMAPYVIYNNIVVIDLHLLSIVLNVIIHNEMEYLKLRTTRPRSQLPYGQFVMFYNAIKVTNVMAQSCAKKRELRWNRRMEWVPG
jgi:hypothetical protein